MNDKYNELLNFSNPDEVYRKAVQIYGPKTFITVSNRKNKKYAIYNPNNDKFVHFGSFNPPMQDYTKHKDDYRRMNYILRASNIKGNWANNPYSPNNLSINLLW